MQSACEPIFLLVLNLFTDPGSNACSNECLSEDVGPNVQDVLQMIPVSSPRILRAPMMNLPCKIHRTAT